MPASLYALSKALAARSRDVAARLTSVPKKAAFRPINDEFRRSSLLQGLGDGLREDSVSNGCRMYAVPKEVRIRILADERRIARTDASIGDIAQAGDGRICDDVVESLVQIKLYDLDAGKGAKPRQEGCKSSVVALGQHPGNKNGTGTQSPYSRSQTNVGSIPDEEVPCTSLIQVRDIVPDGTDACSNDGQGGGEVLVWTESGQGVAKIIAADLDDI